MTTHDEPAPWERQRGESAKAFAAFAHYRDMGPGRSLRGLHGILNRNNIATNLRQLATWSSRWHWVERTKAWDAELDWKARETQLAEIQKMRERHTREAMALQEKALARLRNMDASELSANDVLRYFVEATKLERVSRGEPETIQEHQHTGKDGGPIEIVDLRVKREEILRRIALIAARTGATGIPGDDDGGGAG